MNYLKILFYKLFRRPYAKLKIDNDFYEEEFYSFDMEEGEK